MSINEEAFELFLTHPDRFIAASTAWFECIAAAEAIALLKLPEND